MPFFSERAYSTSLRKHTLRASAQTIGLTFNPSASLLASLQTTGRLTFSRLSSTDGTTPSQHSTLTFQFPAIARALAASTRSETLYIASDNGIHATTWDGYGPVPVLEGVQATAICCFPHSAVVAVVNRTWMTVIDEHDRQPRAMLPTDNDITSLVSLPDSHTFVALEPDVKAISTLRSVLHLRSQGFADGTIHHYDLRRTRAPIHVSKPSTASLTVLATGANDTFLLAGDSSSRLHTLHLPSASTVASLPIPFLPRAAAFASGNFYVGGSDRLDPSRKNRKLLTVDLQCKITGNTPTSAKSVYAIAAHPKSSILAAAGFSPEKASRSSPVEKIDVYVHPPVRSFSFAV